MEYLYYLLIHSFHLAYWGAYQKVVFSHFDVGENYKDSP